MNRSAAPNAAAALDAALAAPDLETAAGLVRHHTLSMTFWESVDAALALIRTHKPATFDAVKLALDVDGYNRADNGPDAAFFGGSGGDDTLQSALAVAGWSTVWAAAGYYYVMRHGATGETLTYVEGDVQRGDTAIRD